MIEAAKGGDKRVRLAALEVIGRLGGAEQVPTLLAIAADADADLAQAAMASLAGLPGNAVNSQIKDRLEQRPRGDRWPS